MVLLSLEILLQSIPYYADINCLFAVAGHPQHGARVPAELQRVRLAVEGRQGRRVRAVHEAGAQVSLDKKNSNQYLSDMFFFDSDVSIAWVFCT